MARQSFSMPLQILKPHYYDVDGTAFVYILNPSGGILQGDRLTTEIVCEEGASAVVTTPGNTKFYRMDEGSAQVCCRLEVRAGGRLEYLPEHNVPFAESDTLAKNEFHVTKGSFLIASDIVTSGRACSSEDFRFSRYSSQTKIYEDGRLILFDNCILKPQEEDLKGIGMLDGNKINGSMYVYSTDMDPEVADEINRSAQSIRLAAGNVSPGLMVIRFIGSSTIEVKDAMMKSWDICRRKLLGKSAVRLRNEF